MLRHDRYDCRFLRACRAEPVDRTPVWFLRQAGRYSETYRAARARAGGFLPFVKNPDLSTHVTVDAQASLQTDAAIVFSDLPLLLETLGFELRYEKGVGPVIVNPLRHASRVFSMEGLNPYYHMPYVIQTIRNCLHALPSDIPLIGFTGAPFTLACYAIEGKKSKDYAMTKRMMYSDPVAWDRFMRLLAEAVRDLLMAQINAGVHAVQLFDSSLGCLNVHCFRQYVMPYLKPIIEELQELVPVIYFAPGAGTYMSAIAELGANVVCFDWRTPIRPMWDWLDIPAVQGNLDPIALCGDWETLEEQARLVMTEVGGKRGHIFNVGQGIVPQTPIENVQRLVEFIHEYDASVVR